jgi:hypothetical protein
MILNLKISEPLAKLVVEESLKNKSSKTLGVLISASLDISEIPSFARGSSNFKFEI